MTDGTMADGERGRGRPEQYSVKVEPRLQEIAGWVSTGMSNADIASLLGVSRQTFERYISEHMELCDTIEGARKEAIAEVKRSFFQLCTGYDDEVREIVQTKGDDGEVDKQVVKITKRRVPPSLSAIAMYLRNYDSGWVEKDSWERSIREAELELKKESLEMKDFRC